MILSIKFNPAGCLGLGIVWWTEYCSFSDGALILLNYKHSKSMD